MEDQYRLVIATQRLTLARMTSSESSGLPGRGNGNKRRAAPRPCAAPAASEDAVFYGHAARSITGADLQC